MNANNFEFKINNVLVSDSEVSMGTRNTSGTDVNKFYVTFNVKAGKYQGADVLYFGESINTNGSNIVAYVKDAAGGKLDLSANYINEITVKVKDTSKIVDITGNPVVTGTELSGK
ncbi:hypothetical protein ACFTAO_43775 [Paenibacillus rhizoplanae]